MFEQKEDVLRFCLRGEYRQQFHSLENHRVITVEEIVGAFVCVLEKNEKLLSLMIKNRLDAIVADEIAKCVSLFANRFVKDSAKKPQLAYSEVILSGALAHLLTYWFRQEDAISLEQLTQLITEFLEGKLFFIGQEE